MENRLSKKAAKEKNVLELLETLESAKLSDDFNQKVLERVKDEEIRASFPWYKSLIALAASIIALVAVWNFSGQKLHDLSPKVAVTDIQVVKNLDLLDKMEVLEHFDVLSDIESTQAFLQLL